MEDTHSSDRYVAAGFSFYTERDAALAESEERKIEYLKARLDYDKPDSILGIYNKAIEERVFRSPVGHFFLKSLQQYLLERPEIDSGAVKAIPLYVSFEQGIREQPGAVRNRIRSAPAKQPKKSAAFPISVILNIALAIAVIAMFGIALNADQPNILNYERAITDNYASWEQELTEREQAVRAKELELNLAP